MAAATKKFTLLAEFADPESLLKAAKALRDSGHDDFDCHSPYPIHGMDQAMGLRRSPLGWIVGSCAFVGAAAALALQWYASTVDYPLVISGKPYFSFQAYVPVTFALAVLLSAFGALFGMLILNRLPRWYHPLFHSERFKKVTDDGFFISLGVGDGAAEREGAKGLLEASGGRNIEMWEDD